MIDERYQQFLLGRTHADKIKHSGRTLYEHLCGTHDLLQAWGNAEPVCNAGLFHSVYGTNKFRHKAWPIERRGIIQKLIGYEPEVMVWIFCTIDRPSAWFVETTEPLEFMCSLREIEAANLLEQGSKSRWLQRLHDSDISDGAKRAIGESMKEEAT